MKNTPHFRPPMPPRTLCFLILLTQLLLACSKGNHIASDHMILWQGTEDADKISYTIDGRAAGQGVEGLQKVFSFLEQCRVGASVYIGASKEDWYNLDDRYHSFDPLAIEVFRAQNKGDFYDRYFAILKDRRIIVTQGYADRNK